ncbi:hypothetical protein CDL24_11225 [Mediterraneibacter gnavus]|nr:hypothetical protein CDL24_11225 [Mediterraneibacter gnavus]
MVIIYFLAIFGAFCLLGIVGMMIAFLWAEYFSEDREPKTKTYTCALTGENCIYTTDKGTCEGCPVLEEAEKIGNRQNG